jgi:hypothetical protein
MTAATHSCIKTRDRENCEGCAYDDLRRARGERVKPQPMEPYPIPSLKEFDAGQVSRFLRQANAAHDKVRATVHELEEAAKPREEVGYREQRCSACGSSLRAGSSRRARAATWVGSAATAGLMSAFATTWATSAAGGTIAARVSLVALVFATATVLLVAMRALRR